MQGFSVSPQRAERLVRADYQLFLAWVAAAAHLGYAVSDRGFREMLLAELRDGYACSHESCLALMRAASTTSPCCELLLLLLLLLLLRCAGLL